MAFHVACPLTCRSICFCRLGFPEKLQSERGRKGFLEEVFRVKEFLTDPSSLFKATNHEVFTTVKVAVPRIEAPPVVVVDGFGTGVGVGGGGGGGGIGDGNGVGGGEDGEELMSVSSKRVALQKKAVAASLAAEDYARRFETGALVDDSGEIREVVGEDQSSSAAKVMCRICFYGENEGSERAMKMPSCKLCNKKYHRNCLKSWAKHRDLFHWSSWVCPSCRTCEICRRTGDPTKFMFCRRCDGAYHCYCQHPPHKNVGHGPYLCPKHTRCHSCGSTVSGSGLSTRWFLGYTCCDACGRLFVKGKYCPVCLKVYRDSESTPMVCCDICQRWVHCQCDGISDEKYMQFQVDRNLYYKCTACRGECYQVKDLDDSIQELWRRRDRDDQDLIASLRAAAGLPSQEDIFSISPYSDDEENETAIQKADHGRSLKISVKGSIDKTTKNTKEYGKKSTKKYGKKKGNLMPSVSKTEGQSHVGLHDTQSFQFSLAEENTDDMSYRSERQEVFSSPAKTPGDTKETCSINQAGFMKHNFVEEAVVNSEVKAPRVVHFKSSKAESVKGKKLVIHLGARNKNVTDSPKSEAESHHKDQDVTACDGSEHTSQQKGSDCSHMVQTREGIAQQYQGEKPERANDLKGSTHRGREGGSTKFGKVLSEVSGSNPKIGRENITNASAGVRTTRVSTGKSAGIANAVEPIIEASTLRNDEVPLRKHSKGTPNVFSGRHNDSKQATASGSDMLTKDPKPLLKLKFKNPYVNNQSSWATQSEEERSSIKGQRSKRKRPSQLEKIPASDGEEAAEEPQENQIDELVDANWILKKLGKDAIGKRVEVHQLSDNSWRKGVVDDVVEGTSTIAVRLDDGLVQTLELGKQGVRFVPQKQKRSRT